MDLGWQTILFTAAFILGIPDAISQFPSPSNLGPTNTYGYGVQRTLRALEQSDPAQKRKTKVLFYGQSITEQPWWVSVKNDLEARYPNAALEIQNRALPGITAPFLEKTAEADLYPYYPDLMIFQVYGSIEAYERIIARTRARTTAEIILQTDHILTPDELTEPTSPELIPAGINNARRNYIELPAIAQSYGTEIADVRTWWKAYLDEYDLAPSSLLRDHIHLNEHGIYLMAQLVAPHLRADLSFEPPADAILDYSVNESANWVQNELVLPFAGNRIDLIFGQTPDPCALQVEIDGKSPSEFPELYAVSRTTRLTGTAWPIVLEVKANTPRVVEDWTLEIIEFNEIQRVAQFKVAGTVTGFDGEGASNSDFASNSGRVVIPAVSWAQSQYMFSIGLKLKAGEKFTWTVYPQFVDEVVPEFEAGSTTENVVTIASGLANGPHTLKLIGGACSGLSAIRIYNPLAMTQPQKAVPKLWTSAETAETITLYMDGTRDMFWRPAMT